METEHVDLVVVGGGRASNLAIAAAKNGQKAVLIEKDRLGGTCPNRGCVPSKLLIGFSESARHVREAERHFLEASLHSVDIQKIFESVNEYTAGVDPRYESRIKDAGVELVRGTGRFVGEKTVEAAGRVFRAETVVIATGTKPNPIPSAFSNLPVWTSDSLFPFSGPVPSSLLIVGGGFIGCEMGAFFSGIGVETTLLSRSERLLTHEDVEIEEIFIDEFRKDVNVHLNANLASLEHGEEGFRATIDIKGELVKMNADNVLFAIGRGPNSAELDLEKTGLEPDPRGFVSVDENLETKVPGIYACGDINGRYLLQHAAAYEVKYLRDRLIKGVNEPIREENIAHAVYSHPEVAGVGLTEAQVQEKGLPYEVVCEDWLASARAMGSRVDYPRTKLIVNSQDYSILGCHMVGPEASTLIHQVMTVMQLDNDVRRIPELIHIHPALNECILAAAVHVIGKVRKREN